MDLTRLHLLRRALAEDRTIDIVTRGAKTGERRRTEIWFTVVGDRVERTRVFSAPENAYYRESTRSLDRLVDEAPLVRVTFTGDSSSLNQSG